MAINENEDLDTDESEEPTGNAMKDLRTLLKKQAKENAELNAELEKGRAEKRKSTIADTLAANGGKAGWARYAAADIEGDVTAEAVLAWLEKEGPDLGWEAPDSDDEEQVENQRQAERVSRATSGAPAGNTAWTVERLKSATDAELLAAGFMNKR